MMKSKDIQREIEKIETILPPLNKYIDGRVADVPPAVRRSLKTIAFAPRLTVSGLEPVNPIIDWLTYARYLAKKYAARQLTR